MRILVVLIFAVALSATLHSQERYTVLARGETTLEGSLPQQMLYAFEHFRDSKIIMNDGTEKPARININLYTGDILFLTSGNQVLVLAYPLDVKHILIDNSKWLQVGGTFWETKSVQGSVVLAGAMRTRITNTRKEGAYGFSSGTSAVGNVSTVVLDGGQIATPLAVGEYDFEKDMKYMLVSETGSAIADAKGFRKIFPENKKQINSYLKANEVNFKNENELISLLEVCSKM
jgi:hypothetical protein